MKSSHTACGPIILSLHEPFMLNTSIVTQNITTMYMYVVIYILIFTNPSKIINNCEIRKAKHGNMHSNTGLTPLFCTTTPFFRTGSTHQKYLFLPQNSCVKNVVDWVVKDRMGPVIKCLWVGRSTIWEILNKTNSGLNQLLLGMC